MSLFDLSSLMKALGRQSGRVQTLQQCQEPRRPNNRAVKQYLLQKGISAPIAESLSFNELAYWREDALDDVFCALAVSSSEIQAGLLSFTVPAGHLGAKQGTEVFVKPSIDDIKKSVDIGGALCVDRSGAFCVNPSGGYAALSHVWSQGLGADDENRGLRKHLLDQVFDKLRPLNVDWIWTDSLAIPGGRRTLSAFELELKGSLINNMPAIYQNAKRVVILDALTLRLDSLDPVKVAVATSMGVWMTRVWTYQEIKLANTAIIATAQGFVDFSDICDQLESLSREEFGEEYNVTSEGLYTSLYKSLARLRRNDSTGVSLVDVALGCADRTATDKLDYARALFPTLGVAWKASYDVHTGMRTLYEAAKHHATRLVLYHGPPRAELLGWAPAVFPGLVDAKIVTAGQWRLRGMLRTWLTTKITGTVPSKPGSLILQLEGQDGTSSLSLGHLSEGMREQIPKALEVFQQSVRQKTAYLLSDEPLAPKQPLSRVGLVVERFSKAEALEAWVLFTLAVGETQPAYKREEVQWLLLHENPLSEHELGGKSTSELNYAVELSVRSSRAR